MSLNGRIIELNTKRTQLEKQIIEEMKRPLGDSLKIKEWKRQKLRIKEELRWLDAG